MALSEVNLMWLERHVLLRISTDETLHGFKTLRDRVDIPYTTQLLLVCLYNHFVHFYIYDK